MKKAPLVRNHSEWTKKNFAQQIIITISMIYFGDRGANSMPAGKWKFACYGPAYEVLYLPLANVKFVNKDLVFLALMSTAHIKRYFYNDYSTGGPRYMRSFYLQIRVHICNYM